MKRQAIGILGGMGPEASVYLYQLLIAKATHDFGARHNDDFPEILLHSIPVPDFISSDDQKERALTMLQERVRLLNKTNISCLAIACNTAHALLPDLQQVSKMPFVSMIDGVVSQVKKDGLRKVGILGTPSTLHAKLYKKALKQQGIDSVEPDERQYTLLEQAIRHVIGGKKLPSDRQNLIALADELKEQGAEGIILGCTELPLIFPSSYTLTTFNSVEILAVALLEKYYKIQKG